MKKGLLYLRQKGSRPDKGSQRILALTGVLVVGCVHMLAEEWLLAPGYFGNVLFWMAFFLLGHELAIVQASPPGTFTRGPGAHPRPA
jgi:hypothetical protein